MKKHHLILLSVLSGILLSLAWPTNGFSPLLLIAFTPLLYIRHYIINNRDLFGRSPIFKYSSLTIFLWNATTTYWVCYASVIGGIIAVLLNTIMFSLAIYLADRIGNKIGKNSFNYIFPAFWILFEYFHLDWDLSWPWMNLGNGFSTATWAIQWYEYTGIFGGTLWVILSNITIFEFFKKFCLLKLPINKRFYLSLSLTGLIVLGPIILSQSITLPDNSKNPQIEVVVIQPNIDPYNEKFNGMSPENQLQKLIQLAETQITPKTQYIIAPETAITQGIFEEEIDEAWSIDTLRSFLKKYPQAKIIIGLSSYHNFVAGEPLTNAARSYGDGSGFYEAYNSALQMSYQGNIQIYHKSKLVAGVEKMPFGGALKPLEKIALDLGGTTGTLGEQTERTVFTSNEKISVAPAICYESIYGEFISEYIKRGANFIAIITNDGWWNDTPGYRQHNSYARLRAIETRRWVVRSANTGISGFIDPSGKIIQHTQWWEPIAIKQNISLNNDITFYVIYGDYIARIAVWFSLMIGLIWLRMKVLDWRNIKTY